MQFTSLDAGFAYIHIQARSAEAVDAEYGSISRPGLRKQWMQNTARSKLDPSRILKTTGYRTGSDFDPRRIALLVGIVIYYHSDVFFCFYWTVWALLMLSNLSGILVNITRTTTKLKLTSNIVGIS